MPKTVTIEMDALVKALSTTEHSGMLLQQPGGLFTTAGLDNVVISTHIQPQGIGQFLPAFASDLDDPRYGFITGFSGATGARPVAPCDDAPKGYMKGGELTAKFGRISQQTETIELTKLGHMQRGANPNLRLLNEMLSGVAVGTGRQMDARGVLDTVVNSEMAIAGVNLERDISTMVWQGDPTNNTAQGGYAEFPGLDQQIATGQVDAATNTTMPAADSYVVDFNYNAVDGTVLDIVYYLSYMEYYLRQKANRSRLSPTTWAIAMRPELWFELSAIWPCLYLTHRCRNDTGANAVVINDNTNADMVQQMRESSTIVINGRTYPVVEDDGIYEHTNITNGNVPAGHYASAIYFVPTRVVGNFPATYWEYIDYRAIPAQIAAMGTGAQKLPFWSDGARFLWTMEFLRTCFDLQVVTEPRMVLRTPQLAAKLQNVMYAPMKHLDSPYPDNPYFLNGGVSTRTIPTSYAVWA